MARPYSGRIGHVVTIPLPVDVVQTLRPLRRGGPHDPCVRLDRDGVWWATRFPSGPATVHVAQVSACSVRAEAWGAGADEAYDRLPALVGGEDTDGGLSQSPHAGVRRMARQLPGLRLCRTGNPFEALVPTILEQRVQGVLAARSYRAMVRACGERAPGPGGLLLPPSADWIARQPSWVWHRMGIERGRAATLRNAAMNHRHVARSESATQLRLLRGVGEWTAAEVRMVAHGDPDAVSVGDYWLKHIVCFALAGEPRGTDDRMLELLGPWAGQRGRLCRVITAAGPAAPRFGPRLPLQDLRAIS